MTEEKYWNDIRDLKPEPNIDIEYINSDGRHGFAYLCPCCKNEWRCIVSGSGLLIDVKKWKYV